MSRYHQKQFTEENKMCCIKETKTTVKRKQINTVEKIIGAEPSIV